LSNWIYDKTIRKTYKPLPKNYPIVIFDIDDKSIEAIGRWPWPRNKLAQIVDKSHELGADLLVFDIIFTEPEKNIVTEIMKEIPSSESAVQSLESIQDAFNYDQQFANSLKMQPSILGFAFVPLEKPVGTLPPPAVTIESERTAQLPIPIAQSYLSSIAVLQEAAKQAGFINATPDWDGIIRSAPLLMRYQNGLYASLALEAARIYLKEQSIQLIIKNYRSQPVLEGIQLGKIQIPTDPWAQILIPFRGPPYSFTYISAIDLLNGQVAKEQIENKILFIGSTATASGDLKATAIAPVFSGTEIQASILSGILDHYLPSEPAWGKGVSLSLILGVGLICALLFPFANPFVMLLITAITFGSLVLVHWWAWTQHAIFIHIFFPLFTAFILLIFNLIYGFVIQASQRKMIRSIFGQYVPNEYLEIMLNKDEKLNLDGESKELTVLFADIFNFTTMSEKMGAPELKHILNQYFTPMTEAIFNHHGTIDKYVGDMVMAFWGAPLEDLKHSFDAVCTALDMQKRLSQINEKLRSDHLPEIQIGIGINTGTMNVGDMGSEFRRAYTVLGDEVNLGARLERLTRIYQVGIIVGEATWAQTKDDFVYRSLGKVKVKGKKTVTEIFQPICLASEKTPQIEEELKMHHEALEKYYKRDWDGAEKLLSQLRQKYPQSAPLYEVFLKRIDALKKTAPPEDWDGVFSLSD
jgi:adenylate cyclase